jgi:hypothetical protein
MNRVLLQLLCKPNSHPWSSQVSLLVLFVLFSHSHSLQGPCSREFSISWIMMCLHMQHIYIYSHFGRPLHIYTELYESNCLNCNVNVENESSDTKNISVNTQQANLCQLGLHLSRISFSINLNLLTFFVK